MSWNTIGEFVLSGAVGSAIVAGITFLLAAVVSAVVKHHFDGRFEKLKDSISRNSARLDTIQASTLTLMSARHAAIDNRRLKAIETLWAATVSQRRLSMAVSILQRLKVDEIAKTMKAGGFEAHKSQEFGDALFKVAGFDKLQAPVSVPDDSERLFVPPLAWAAYEALRSVGTHAVAVLASMKAGVGPDIVKDIGDVNKLVLVALPFMEDYLKKYPDSGVYFLTGHLEQLIFDQLANALNFPDSDREIINKTSSIIGQIAAGHVEIPANIPEKFKRVDVNPAV